jgi:hypothetical protein
LPNYRIFVPAEADHTQDVRYPFVEIQKLDAFYLFLLILHLFVEEKLLKLLDIFTFVAVVVDEGAIKDGTF